MEHQSGIGSGEEEGHQTDKDSQDLMEEGNQEENQSRSDRGHEIDHLDIQLSSPNCAINEPLNNYIATTGTETVQNQAKTNKSRKLQTLKRSKRNTKSNYLKNAAAKITDISSIISKTTETESEENFDNPLNILCTVASGEKH